MIKNYKSTVTRVKQLLYNYFSNLKRNIEIQEKFENLIFEQIPILIKLFPAKL